VSWTLFGAAIVAFVLALLPTRRLFLSGWRPAPLALYLGALMALAVAALFVHAGIRVVVPVLLVLYILPFIGAPEIVARTVARIGSGGGERPGPRIVEGTARDVDPPGTGRAAGTGSTDPAAAEPGGSEDGPGTSAGAPPGAS
jgi:hypothetical protein